MLLGLQMKWSTLHHIFYNIKKPLANLEQVHTTYLSHIEIPSAIKKIVILHNDIKLLLVLKKEKN